jgi:hypothetical protein
MVCKQRRIPVIREGGGRDSQGETANPCRPFVASNALPACARSRQNHKDSVRYPWNGKPRASPSEDRMSVSTGCREQPKQNA